VSCPPDSQAEVFCRVLQANPRCKVDCSILNGTGTAKTFVQSPQVRFNGDDLFEISATIATEVASGIVDADYAGWQIGSARWCRNPTGIPVAIFTIDEEAGMANDPIKPERDWTEELTVTGQELVCWRPWVHWPHCCRSSGLKSSAPISRTGTTTDCRAV
jgi:hypothetical protein